MRILSAIALTGTVIMLAGCSGGSSGAGTSPQGIQAKEAADSSASGAPATIKAQYLPLLRQETAQAIWPKAYAISADTIWDFTETTAQDTLLTATDARQSVEAYNTCAWSLQLIKDTKGSHSNGTDLNRLSALSVAQPGMKDFLDSMISEAKLGGITKTQQYVEANQCVRFFAK